MAKFDLASQPAPQSCRLIAFDDADVRPGFVPRTWFLTVTGEAPCANMEVRLVPLIYVQCPEYWGIEVVGCLPSGVCLRQVVPYRVTIPLNGIIGSRGIEVIGSNKRQEIEVADGCKSGTAFTASD